jgi:tetratricopeptide (TPR) repeat protein
MKQQLWLRRGRLHARLGQWDKAEAVYARAIELYPGEREAWAGWAKARSRARGHEQIEVRFERFVPLVFINNPTSHQQACMRLLARDRESYRKLCAEKLAKADLKEVDREFYEWGRNVVMTCALAPDAVTDWEPVCKLAEKKAAEPGVIYGSHFNDIRGALAATLFRAGRAEEAIRRFSELIALQEEGASGSDCLFLALAHHRLGHADKAREWLARGRTQIDKMEKEKNRELDEIRKKWGDLKVFEVMTTTNIDRMWILVELELLRQEAEEQINGTRP